MAMGVPEHVLTDNMKSVVIRRDLEGRPVWQADCRVHGVRGVRNQAVSRAIPSPRGRWAPDPVREGELLAGRRFSTPPTSTPRRSNGARGSRGAAGPSTACREDAAGASRRRWRDRSSRSTSAVAAHQLRRVRQLRGPAIRRAVLVPGKTCRVSRDGVAHIYSEDLSRELAAPRSPGAAGTAARTSTPSSVELPRRRWRP